MIVFVIIVFILKYCSVTLVLQCSQIVFWLVKVSHDIYRNPYESNRMLRSNFPYNMKSRCWHDVIHVETIKLNKMWAQKEILSWAVKTSSKDDYLMYREKGCKEHWPEQLLFPQVSSDTLSILEKAYIWTASWAGFEGANMECFDVPCYIRNFNYKKINNKHFFFNASKCFFT